MSFFHRIQSKYSLTLSQLLGYSEKDILVIVNIDDVGLHEDESSASFKALKFGIAKTGSIMVPCKNFIGVMEFWKRNPEIDLGIHLTLTCEWGEKYPWAPVLSKADVPSLYNPEGIMWPDMPELLHHAKQIEIKKELEAQINKIFDFGLKPTHLDDHMDLHNNEYFFPMLMELSRKYNLPMRVWKRKRYKYPFLKNNLISLRKKGFVFPDSQKGIYYMGSNDKSYNFRKAIYYEYLRSLKPGVHTIKIHVASQSKELQDILGSEDLSIRKIDYDVWTSDDTKKLADELGIVFIGYKPLKRLQEGLMKEQYSN